MGREIEVKMFAQGAYQADVATFLKAELLDKCDKFESGSSIDLYWKCQAEGASARLRVNNEAVFTVKVNDKGTIKDRQEWNIDIPFSQKDDFLNAMSATTSSNPTPIMFTWTDYYIGKDTVISMIVNVEAQDYVFVEVESAERAKVDFWVKRLKEQAQFELKEVKNSFHDIFVKKQGVLL